MTEEKVEIVESVSPYDIKIGNRCNALYASKKKDPLRPVKFCNNKIREGEKYCRIHQKTVTGKTGVLTYHQNYLKDMYKIECSFDQLDFLLKDKLPKSMVKMIYEMAIIPRVATASGCDVNSSLYHISQYTAHPFERSMYGKLPTYYISLRDFPSMLDYTVPFSLLREESDLADKRLSTMKSVYHEELNSFACKNCKVLNEHVSLRFSGSSIKQTIFIKQHFTLEELIRDVELIAEYNLILIAQMSSIFSTMRECERSIDLKIREAKCPTEFKGREISLYKFTKDMIGSNKLFIPDKSGAMKTHTRSLKEISNRCEQISAHILEVENRIRSQRAMIWGIKD